MGCPNEKRSFVAGDNKDNETWVEHALCFLDEDIGTVRMSVGCVDVLSHAL